MHIAHGITNNTAIRLGLAIGAARPALIGVTIAVRPDMMAASLSMIHGLVAGLGL